MKFYLAYIIVIFLIIPLIYLLIGRNEYNKIQTNYLSIVLFTLLINTLDYSYSLYTTLPVNIYYFFFVRIIHFIFIFKYVATFQSVKRLTPLYLYAPLVVFSVVYLFNYNGYYIFSYEYLNYIEFNFFDLNSSTLKGSKDLFITTIFIGFFFIIIISNLVKQVLRKSLEGKKKFNNYRNWIILLYLYVLSSSLAFMANTILLIFDLNFNSLFILNKIILLFSTVILMLFPKYVTHFTSFKVDVKRLKCNNDDEQYLKIVQSLQKTHMFLNPKKNLSHLAISTKMSPKLIIDLIYEFESLSVANYLIKLRIKYAKQKIAEGYLDKFSIEALLFESGFKSPQTFYRNFKKFEGITPKDYHDSLR
jgi:AraC-like DNA-binding protein